ncbi:unnamed protein product [Brassica oleracea var. botrytis]
MSLLLYSHTFSQTLFSFAGCVGVTSFAPPAQQSMGVSTK